MVKTSLEGSFIFPAGEQGQAFVVCHSTRLQHVRQLVSRDPIMRSGDCLFFALALGEDAAVLLGPLRSERLLDRFHLIPESQSSAREALLSGFFDAIADDYHDLVDPQRNHENIEYLVDWLVGNLRAGDGPLIDLGCGTGVSREIVERTGRSVIGVEAAPRMRTLAEVAGMTVVGPDSVSALPTASGAIASYVLHLDPRPRELPALLARLGERGSLVANVHKSHGLTELKSYVHEIGATLERGAYDKQHGTYVRIYAG